ncbi:MAG: RNA polymerase factor sigma-70 [Halothiobacillus sp.]|nr:RNA polymerase factor sigma-70 [Halothiobacillus sp.]
MNKPNALNGSPNTTDMMATLADPVFLQDLRRQMLKFATLQLSDEHSAEDAVQEALVGALKNAQSFGGRAALKTWMFAILKYKIADLLRQRQRVVTVSPIPDEDDEDQRANGLFNTHGHWHTEDQPAAWRDPESSIQDQQFWQIFEACLAHLPVEQGRIFMMREFIELESHEICAAVGISTSNLHVILHRARLRLRACLEHQWFVPEDSPC